MAAPAAGPPGSTVYATSVGELLADGKGVPKVGQPEHLAHFSLSREGVDFDARALPTFREPPLGADLREAYVHFVGKEHGPPSLAHPLEALARLGKVARASIVSWRGNLTKLLIAPFSKDIVEVGLRCSDGVVLMDVRETAEEVARQRAMTPYQRQLAYSGYRFEQMCTEGADLAQAPDPARAFCIVVSTKLGQHRLVLAAEVDCTARAGDTSCLIELKTSRTTNTERARETFQRHKLLRYWAQSFLVGVDTIVCGKRDEDLKLRSIERLRTLDIPRMVRDVPHQWRASTCLVFVDRLLSWIIASLTRLGAFEDEALSFVLRFDGEVRLTRGETIPSQAISKELQRRAVRCDDMRPPLAVGATQGGLAGARERTLLRHHSSADREDRTLLTAGDDQLRSPPAEAPTTS